MIHRLAFLLGIGLMPLVPSICSAQQSDSASWSVIAGTGQTDSQVANEPSDPQTVALRNVYGIEVTDDAIYFSTVDDHSIWKCDRQLTKMQRFAGTGQQGYSGDGGPAIKATFNAPHEIRADAAGNLFVADTRNHCIRRIDHATGQIETLGGDGVAGFRGDGGPGKQARFDQPHSIVLDGDGGVLVADTKNHRLRRIDLQSGIVSTIAGDGRPQLPTAGNTADQVSVFGPRSLAIDDNAVWLVLREGNSVWRIDRATNKIRRVAGTGGKGYSGDGGDPLLATFRGPKGIAVDSAGNLLVVDTENQALRYVDLEQNRISTLPIEFELKRPHGAAVIKRHRDVDVYLLSDSENHRVLANRVLATQQ
ncbi:hypothetical protein NHH03_11285 [Stieleria sp. TO1_6]|uniref:hypothetical protein n=1 Tax=Stieleria tagensis TaxID=2956795 RepID=UPI00209A99CD|nr:hypothetical protein [Stieleria tagensis]MCO8122324.1 hypothetical protein [Stieleria tagensis]